MPGSSSCISMSVAARGGTGQGNADKMTRAEAATSGHQPQPGDLIDQDGLCHCFVQTFLWQSRVKSEIDAHEDRTTDRNIFISFWVWL